MLWDRGPSTVREVCEEMSRTKPTGYTTVLKLLQIMTAKGLVARDENERAHVYSAVEPEESTKRQLVSDLLTRALSGSASQLMMHGLSGKKTSSAEIDEIRRMLDVFERRES